MFMMLAAAVLAADCCVGAKSKFYTHLRDEGG